MAIQPVNHHAGNLLIESERTKEVLTNQYDSTFPITLFRERINFMGGGKKPQDYSPELVVRREIQGEVSIEAENEADELVAQDAGVATFEIPKITKYASNSDVDAFRSYILDSMLPYQDFLMDFTGFKSNPEAPKLKLPQAIFSIFYSRVDQDLFEMVRQNLQQGRSLVNDGFLRITSLDELVSGNPLCAWATGRILEYHFKMEIPNPEGIIATPMGNPRASFQDYLNEFSFIRGF